MTPRLTAPLSLLLLLPLALFADRPRGHHDGPRVTLFEHADFQGGAIELRPGDSLDNLADLKFDNGRRANDRISSILVEGEADVMVYTDSRFRGSALRVTRDVRDLAESDRHGPRFNDRISSLRVSFVHRPRPEPSRPVPGPMPGPGPHLNYEQIISRAVEDVLERKATEHDLRTYRSQMIERNWGEREVRDALRKTEEYRVTVMTNRLNRVYREVLGRDVDPSGFEHYRNKIIEHAWNDDDIRRDLKNSAEYRARGGGR